MHRGRYNFDEGVYGEISVKDNDVTTVLQATVLTQITVFDTNGPTKQMESDAVNDHIMVKKSGVYKAHFSMHVNNAEAQSQVIDVSLYANNGTEEFLNVHGHRLLSGGSGDVGSMSAAGRIEVDAGETLELWATSDSITEKEVVFEDVTLTVGKDDL